VFIGSRFTDALELMKRFRADSVFRIAGDLQSVIGGASAKVLSLEGRRTARSIIVEQLLPEAEASDLHLAADLLVEFIERLDNPRPLSEFDVARILDEFSSRVVHELKRRIFVYIPPDRARHLDEQLLGRYFGEGVANAFPELASEIDEASRCLGFGCNTAAVFHLMRVVEIGLRAMATEIGVDRQANSWGGIIGQLEARLSEIDATKKTPEIRKTEKRIADLRLTVDAIRRAWRNPTVHEVATNFTDEQAERVYQTVRDFMQILATRS